jgi:hypothetical protein
MGIFLTTRYVTSPTPVPAVDLTGFSSETAETLSCNHPPSSSRFGTDTDANRLTVSQQQTHFEDTRFMPHTLSVLTTQPQQQLQVTSIQPRLRVEAPHAPLNDDRPNP